MRALFVSLLLLTAPAHAEIYKLVDENGRATYTDRLPRGVKPALVIPDLKPASPQPPQEGEKKPRNGYKSSASPAHFPKVDSDTQRKRDGMRRDLLKEELGNEERELASARAALAVPRPGSDGRVLAEGVRLHEKNIEMLNKELARIR